MGRNLSPVGIINAQWISRHGSRNLCTVLRSMCHLIFRILGVLRVFQPSYGTELSKDTGGGNSVTLQAGCTMQYDARVYGTTPPDTFHGFYKKSLKEKVGRSFYQTETPRE